MKFELKTENDYYSKLLVQFLMTFFSLAMIIIFCDIAHKLRIISRNYQFEYYCKILSIEKSTSNFKKLSNISNLKSKQRIWDFCKEFVK